MQQRVERVEVDDKVNVQDHKSTFEAQIPTPT